MVLDSVRVRALIDQEAQVSLVHKELIPKIQERNGWTLEERHNRIFKLKGQTNGAGGHELARIWLL